MFYDIKKHIQYWNKHFKHGTMLYICATVCRFMLFPMFLFMKLWNWVFYDEYMTKRKY